MKANDWSKAWKRVARMIDDGKMDEAIDVARDLVKQRPKQMRISDSIAATILRMAPRVKERAIDLITKEDGQ